MAIKINTIYTTTKLKGDSSSGISTSTTYYGMRYLCEKPVVDTTVGTIQYTIYFQPYLENDSSSNRWDTDSPYSGNVSYFRIDGVTYNFWIKYDLSANGDKQFLTNSSNNSEFWIQNASSASSNIVDVSRVFNQTGARGLKYVFSVAIDSISADQTLITKTISYKITPPTGGSDGFKGTSNTSISIELPLPDFLSAPTSFSAIADYTYNSIGVFKSDVTTSSIRLTWRAPTTNGTNAIANYILRYAISSTNSIPNTLSSSISLDTTNNLIDISNTAFKSVLNSISEGQYLFVAIQVAGTEFTKNEYSNIITLRKNIRPSAPTITGSTYYDNNYNITFTIKAQNGVINTSACNFSYGSKKGQSAGTHTYTFGSTDSMVLTFYAEDGLGDKSEGTVVNYSLQSTLKLTLEPNMAKVINNYAAVINSFDYTITGGSGPYTISLKIANTQIVSFTTSYPSNTYTFSTPLNVLNYGVSRGIDYNITMTVSDSTNASSSVSKTYQVPALSFTIAASGEAGKTDFNKEINYIYNTTGTSMGYSVIYNGKTINLSNTGSGIFSVTSIPYGTSTNFVFCAQDQLGLYVTNTIELTRISASDAPPTPIDFTIDVTSLYTLKPLSKRLIASNNTEDKEINATWYNEKNEKKYKIYVVYGIYEIEVATVQSSGSGDTASSAIEINDDFFKNFTNTHSNSTISGQFRMYGYDETYGFSDTYATATSSTNINDPLNFTISFQEVPYFAPGAKITDVIIDSIYGQPTIPNPGDTITLNFPKANDYNSNEISYKIYEEVYDASNNLISFYEYEPTIGTGQTGGYTASFQIANNTYENNKYLIKVEPYTSYGYGVPLSYEYDYKGRVANPSFEVVSSSVDNKVLTINCKFNDKGGNNKGTGNFKDGFVYTVYKNGDLNSYTDKDKDTFSITVDSYIESKNTEITLIGYAANNNQQQVTSSLSYIHYVAEPTVAYRKNYLGINTSAPAGGDVIIDIHAYSGYQKVKLVGSKKTITINLSDGSIDGAIISGGEWK